MITPEVFFKCFSLYGALIGTWSRVESDLVVHMELAGYNQPEFDRQLDAEIRPVVMIFKSVFAMNEETRFFSVPQNGDARVISQEMNIELGSKSGILELTCEVEIYASSESVGAVDYVTLAFRFGGVEVVDAPQL